MTPEMKHSQQAQELSSKLWAIANDLRGSMDAAKFKNYILGIIFYRYLSERTERYMDDLLQDDNVAYQDAFTHEELAPVVKDWSLEHLGYIIEPKYLFGNLIEDIRDKKFSIEDLEKAVSSLTGSTIGQPSEAAFDKLFDDMNLQDKDLGRAVSERTDLISKVMLRVSNIDFMLDDAQFDVLGTAYMILIGLFASDAGKKGGEFFTPAAVSRLVAQIATLGLDEVKSCCDPCAGSGSMLLEVKNHLSTGRVGHYWAQEMNSTTYNLTRMNMLMHGVPYQQFTVFNDDTLKRDNFVDERFMVQVSNPPYSAKWSSDSSYMDDPRFSAVGRLAPKSYADLAFLQHIIYHMDDDGRAAVLLPHGVLFRGGAEYAIRKHIISEQNIIDAIIGLPANLFHGTSIPVALIVLREKRNGNADNILFVDASQHFTKDGNKNILIQDDIDRILDAYEGREDIDKLCRVVPMSEIVENDYNLNISRYVDISEEEEMVDLVKVKEQLRNIQGMKMNLETSFLSLVAELKDTKSEVESL